MHAVELPVYLNARSRMPFYIDRYARSGILPVYLNKVCKNLTI